MGQFHVICKLGRKSRRISSCFSSACQGQIFAWCVMETMIEEDLICPISQSIMQDPVKCSDHTYERQCIEALFELALEKGSPSSPPESTTQPQCISPMTRQILHAQEGNVQVKWCEASGYGDSRKVLCPRVLVKVCFISPHVDNKEIECFTSSKTKHGRLRGRQVLRTSCCCKKVPAVKKE
jgi:hypothetical protein